MWENAIRVLNVHAVFGLKVEVQVSKSYVKGAVP